MRRPLPIPFLAFCGILGGLPAAAAPADSGAVSAIEVMMEAQMEEARQPLLELDGKYRGALEKKRATAQEAGDLDALVAITTELENLSGGLDSVPAPKPPDLAKMRRIYQDQRTKILPQVEKAVLVVERSYTKDMGQLVVDLTKAGKTDEAVKVQGRLDAFVRERETARKRPGGVTSAEPPAPKLPKTPRELSEFILGTSWSVSDIKPREGMVFHPNGEFKDKVVTCKYVVTGPNTVTVNWDANTAIRCEFSGDFTTMREINGARKTFRLLGRVKY